ncbi:MAG: 30S ribosomal protein S6 [bacterium]|nr:30S ribosomal protein S6 [bacterium]
METKKYQLTTALKPDLSAEESQRAPRRVAEAVESLGGRVAKTESLGIKPLVYAIQGFEQASFGQFILDLPPAQVRPLRSELEKNRSFLRVLVRVLK